MLIIDTTKINAFKKRNKSVQEPEIIPLNKNDYPPPSEDPISNDESSYDDSFVEYPHIESEGDFFEDVYPVAPPTPLPSEAPSIDPDGATVPPNNYPEGSNPSPEGYNSHNLVCNRDKNNSLERLNLNIELYDLTCGHHHRPTIANNLSQKRKRLNYKQYRRCLKDESSISLNSMHLADSITTIS